MVTVKKEPFGTYTALTLINNQTKEYCTTIPEFGANLNALSLQKRGQCYSLIDGDKSCHALREHRWFKEAKLAPFPNRVDGGEYTFQERIYRMPINFTLQTHAIHGFAYDKAFTVKLDKMPLGDGWHPYFSLNETVDSLWLKVPPCRKIEVNDKLIPTGKQVPYDMFVQPRQIGTMLFDDGFVFDQNGGVLSTEFT